MNTFVFAFINITSFLKFKKIRTCLIKVIDIQKMKRKKNEERGFKLIRLKSKLHDAQHSFYFVLFHMQDYVSSNTFIRYRYGYLRCQVLILFVTNFCAVLK